MIRANSGSLWWRVASRFLAIKPVTLFFMHLATWVDRPLLKLSAGRWRLSFVVPVLLLRCRGARTGRLREVPLMFVPDDDAPLLIGSNGGRSRDPAWCHNLRHGPDVSCVVDGAERHFRAVELGQADRPRAWQSAVALYPGYARYAQRAQRTIPLFRLIPREPQVGALHGVRADGTD